MAKKQRGGMSREEAIAMLKAGMITEWNDHRAARPDWCPDLSHADFLGTYLHGADLSRVNLSHADLMSASLCGANLSRANLSRASLSSAKLIGAKLIGADLHYADISGADLNGADLSGADLNGAFLSGADLSGADLNGAFLHLTSFGNNDLSEVKGLGAVVHIGPSYVDTHTLLRSKGKISKSFLQGCGIQESWITYLPSLIASIEPIQFYSCFISHSTQDAAFCNKLHRAMRKAGLRVWYAPHDLKGDAKIADEIDDAIQQADKLVLVLSEASITSEWVLHEIRRAIDKETTTGMPVLFPIGLAPIEELRGSAAKWDKVDPISRRNIAAELFDYLVRDFTRWNDRRSFTKAFDRLIDALKADEKQKPEKSK